MMRHTIEGIIPNATACYDLMLELEDAFNVSLKFWVSLGKPTNGSVIIHVYCAGSGTVFDLLHPDDTVVHSPVLSSQNGSIYPALWSCLSQFRTIFARHMKPIPR